MSVVCIDVFLMQRCIETFGGLVRHYNSGEFFGFGVRVCTGPICLHRIGTLAYSNIGCRRLTGSHDVETTLGGR